MGEAVGGAPCGRTPSRPGEELEEEEGGEEDAAVGGCGRAGWEGHDEASGEQGCEQEEGGGDKEETRGVWAGFRGEDGSGECDREGALEEEIGEREHGGERSVGGERGVVRERDEVGKGDEDGGAEAVEDQERGEDAEVGGEATAEEQDDECDLEEDREGEEGLVEEGGQGGPRVGVVVLGVLEVGKQIARALLNEKKGPGKDNTGVLRFATPASRKRSPGTPGRSGSRRGTERDHARHVMLEERLDVSCGFGWGSDSAKAAASVKRL